MQVGLETGSGEYEMTGGLAYVAKPHSCRRSHLPSVDLIRVVDGSGE